MGNITAILDESALRAYAYDALGRLIGAEAPDYQLGWSYDANGNRLSQSASDGTTQYTIATDSNRLLQAILAETTNYQYDANGSLVADGEHSYGYDVRGRLVSVDEGETANYLHNALGQRVYKRAVGAGVSGDMNGDGIINSADLHAVNGQADPQQIECDGPGNGKAKGRGQTVSCLATQIGSYARNGQGQAQGETVQTAMPQGTLERVFAYGQSGELLGEYELSAQAVQETVWLGGLPVATVRDGQHYAVHTDHLGTPRAVTDLSGTVLWRWRSDPFGVAVADEDPDGDGQGFVYNLRFPGQYYDSETGKHYNYFRDYDPATGRYIESDPIGLDGGLAPYTYVASNSINRIDAFGLYWDCSYWSGANCRWVEPSNMGPFEGKCGPEGSVLATWIPDITPRACDEHDKCYDKCAKGCAGTRCKLVCDLFLWLSNGPYGLATAFRGDDTYKQLREKYKCNSCTK